MSNSQVTSLAEVRKRKIGGAEKELLDELWKEFLVSGKWPVARILHSPDRKARIREVLGRMGGSFVFEAEDHQDGHRYQATFLGVLMTTAGDRLLVLVTRYLEFLRTLFQTKPQQRSVNHQEVQEALQISPDECTVLGKLVVLAGLYSGSCGYSQDSKSWNAGVLNEVEDYPSTGNLAKEAEWLALRNYDEGAKVFMEERRESYSALNWKPAISETASNGASDAMNRRYQVFVSSPYEDLEEERRKAMHALLETMCIPTGMELFPAASEEQTKLIKRIIDDCDYYVVIVAGRYGSIGPDGIGYTEMEFDYALKTGKPVLAFFHSNASSLPQSKCEGSVTGKRKLAKFVAKLKRARLCKAWQTADGLASAIKSAILHAIVHDPKPGWVRAKDVASREAVANLTKAVGLQGNQFGAKREAVIPEKIQFKGSINYRLMASAKKNPEGVFIGHRTMEHSFERSLEALFLIIGPRLHKKNHRAALKIIFEKTLVTEAERIIPTVDGATAQSVSVSLERTAFDRCLDTLVARKFLKRVRQPAHVRLKELYWQVAPKGIQLLAELQSL